MTNTSSYANSYSCCSAQTSLWMASLVSYMQMYSCPNEIVSNSSSTYPLLFFFPALLIFFQMSCSLPLNISLSFFSSHLFSYTPPPPPPPSPALSLLQSFIKPFSFSLYLSLPFPFSPAFSLFLLSLSLSLSLSIYLSLSLSLSLSLFFFLSLPTFSLSI